MKKVLLIIVVLGLLFLLVFSANFVLLSKLNSSINNSKVVSETNAQIDSKLIGVFDELHLKKAYKTKNPKYEQIQSKIIKNFKPCALGRNYTEIWDEANAWVEANEIYPQYDMFMCKLIKALQIVPLVAAVNSGKGTQLKLNLLVEGNQTVYFKPAWYSRERVIDGPVYSGKDRHNSEVVAFYLGALMGLRWTPIAVGRAVNLKEIWKVGDEELQGSMFVKQNSSRLCLYGKCFYCKSSEAVCGNKTHFVEGVLLFQVPEPIAKHKSPWRRTYKDGMKATWEESGDNNYCDFVKTKLSLIRILDLIDASVFDFLIQNGDRHHHESRKKRIVLIDNGKGFGNPHIDFTDILAPLYQCCLIRKATYSRLLIFTGGSLSEMLRTLTKNDLLFPILTDNHFAALERRLLKVFSVIEFCRERHGNSIFK